MLPMNHVLAIIRFPNAATRQKYTIKVEDLNLTIERFLNLKQLNNKLLNNI